MTFGEKLQRLRKEAGLSQEELAGQLHVSRQAVSKWERNESYPETEKLIRMGTLFGVTLDELLQETRELGKNAGPTEVTEEREEAALGGEPDKWKGRSPTANWTSGTRRLRAVNWTRKRVVSDRVPGIRKDLSDGQPGIRRGLSYSAKEEDREDGGRRRGDVGQSGVFIS